eukprot:3922281-Pyramimonas_sp.AAC.2
MCGAGNRVSRVHVAEGWASHVQGVPEERGQGFVQGVRRHARPGCRLLAANLWRLARTDPGPLYMGTSLNASQLYRALVYHPRVIGKVNSCLWFFSRSRTSLVGAS